MNSKDRDAFGNPKQPEDKPASTRRELAGLATGSLTDEEVTQVGQVVRQLIMKYSALPPTENNLARLDDEASDVFHRMGYLIHLDIEPCFEGCAPVLEILGRVNDVGFQKPFDHEHGMYDVKKAHARGEYFLGEREPVNSIAAKRRNKLILPKNVEPTP